MHSRRTPFFIIIVLLFLSISPSMTTTTFKRAYEDRFCPPAYLSCATISEQDVCCPVEYTCQYDDSGAVACCKFRNECHGSLATARNNNTFTQSDPTTSGSPSLVVYAGGWRFEKMVVVWVVVVVVACLEWRVAGSEGIL
jgi:hypothetical protein